MIDAHAVMAQLEPVRVESSKEEGTPRTVWMRRLQQSLGGLPVQEGTDANGNYWVTLPGASDRALVLGTGAGPGSDGLLSRFGVVTALETIKALARRYDGPPPCALQMVIWADGRGAEGAAEDLRNRPGQKVVAYLGLHGEPQTAPAEAALGVVTAIESGEPMTFHPRLLALCEEAIRELTGTTASVVVGAAPVAAAIARSGIPTALMYVQVMETAAEAPISDVSRLHLLQAAEAFGRWTEATLHLLAGEEVDTWALEHRVPHSAAS